MSRIKHPKAKKRASLAKDHRVFPLEGNKSFRSAWRKKKAAASRRFRRADTMARGGGADPADLPVAKPTRTLRKLGVASLAQAIGIKAGFSRIRWNTRLLRKKPESRSATLARVFDRVGK